MEWIKKNPHLVTLAALALLLVGASAMVILQTQSLPQKFETVQQPVIPNEKVPPLDTQVLDETQKLLIRPANWAAPDVKTNGPLFVPERYLIGDKNTPEKPGAGTKQDSFPPKPLIPNQWFIDNNLPVLDPGVTRMDPDDDLFWNEDEWRGTGAVPGTASTNPNDPKSHPPYHTKLFLKQWIRVPFRLKFNAPNGDPKNPAAMTFQINTVDLNQPSVFLPLGATIPGTKFKIEKFEYKTVVNPATRSETDVSELTLVNADFPTEPIVLVLGKQADSPNSFAEFTYLLGKLPPFRVARLGTFALPQEKDKIYKLLDVKENEAVITLPSGEKLTITKLPAGYP